MRFWKFYRLRCFYVLSGTYRYEFINRLKHRQMRLPKTLNIIYKRQLLVKFFRKILLQLVEIIFLKATFVKNNCDRQTSIMQFFSLKMSFVLFGVR